MGIFNSYVSLPEGNYESSSKTGLIYEPTPFLLTVTSVAVATGW